MKRKKTAGILLLCIVSAVVLSCRAPSEDAWKGMLLYYINTDETAIKSEPYVHTAENTKDLIDEMIEALELPPSADTLKKAKPDAVKILDYSYEKDQPLVLNFDHNYAGLSGTTEVLCRAAIVMNFFQIPDVELVEFYVGGQPLMYSSELPVGLMRADDFMVVDSTLMNYKDEAVVTLYFANETGDMLLPDQVTVSYDGIISYEQLIMKLLLDGPQDEGYQKTIPEDTAINKISTKDHICYVDLSSEFMNKRQEVSAGVAIYSIVNSLIENTSIFQVQFLIDGEKRKLYHDIEFNGFFERNLPLIQP